MEEWPALVADGVEKWDIDVGRTREAVDPVHVINVIQQAPAWSLWALVCRPRQSSSTSAHVDLFVPVPALPPAAPWSAPTTTVFSSLSLAAAKWRQRERRLLATSQSTYSLREGATFHSM